MRKLSLTTLTAAAVLGFGASAFALPSVNGSLSISTSGPTDTGPLNTRTVFDTPDPSNVGNGVTGSFAGFVNTGDAVALSGFDTTVPTSMAAVSSMFSFTSTSVQLIGTATPTAIAYLFTGTLTTTGTLGNAFVGGPASLRVSLTRSGSAGGGFSTSESVTLAAPPETITVPVPEPASMALLGLGLLGVGLIRRRNAS